MARFDIFDIDKGWLILGGIGLYIIAWVFYYSPIEYTSIGLLFHYAALGLIGFGLLEQDKRKKLLIFIIIYIISLLLDYPFYEVRHGLTLGLFYYIAVNMIHVMLLLSILVIGKESQNLTIFVFIVFFIDFYLWGIMPSVSILIVSTIIVVMSLSVFIGIWIYYLKNQKISEKK